MTYQEKQERARERRRRFMAKLIIIGVNGGRCHRCGAIYLVEDAVIGKTGERPHTVGCSSCGEIVEVKCGEIVEVKVKP